MATIDGKYIWVDKEPSSFDVDITSQPVEKDIDMTDHVQRKARTLTLNGEVSGEDAAEIHDYLVNASDTGKIVKYIGRMSFSGLISGLSTDRSYQTADGFTFTFTLTEVRIAQSSYINKLPVPVKAQAAKIVNSGVKQTKSNKSTKSKDKKTKDKKKSTKKTSSKKEPVKKVKFKKGSPWAG
ncbi:phage baseplate protein [Paenibacillus sp. SAF-054]|uniref:phage baseplate protein n=1 Tax=unclassified Paenibacillus TaxID=185978 RepID=UPI003F820154